MPRKKTASLSALPPSSPKGKSPVEDDIEEEEDEHMEDVEEEGTASNNSDSDESDDNYEEYENEDEDEDEDVALDQSPFIRLDVSRIKSEQYIILRHVN